MVMMNLQVGSLRNAAVGTPGFWLGCTAARPSSFWFRVHPGLHSVVILVKHLTLEQLYYSENDFDLNCTLPRGNHSCQLVFQSLQTILRYPAFQPAPLPVLSCGGGTNFGIYIYNYIYLKYTVTNPVMQGTRVSYSFNTICEELVLSSKKTCLEECANEYPQT